MNTKLTLTAYIALMLAIPMLLCGCVVWVIEEVSGKRLNFWCLILGHEMMWHKTRYGNIWAVGWECTRCGIIKENKK